MKQELVEKLLKKYPTVYKNLGGDPRKTCMAFGLEIGDGWFDIIDNLSKVLEQYNITAAQVKEKFGSLRFYLESYPGEKIDFDKIDKAINEAEKKSSITCEYCGDPGKLGGKFWVKTLCVNCRKSVDNK